MASCGLLHLKALLVGVVKNLVDFLL